MTNLAEPAIVTREMCARAIRMALPSIRMGMETGVFNQEAGVLTVLNPAIPYEPKYQGGPTNEKFVTDLPFFLYPFGEIEEWGLGYLLIALSKGYGTWATGYDSGQIPLALYRPGMSTFPGAIRGRSGAVISFSGVQGYFDKAITGIFDACLCGLAEQDLATLEDTKSPHRRSLPVVGDIDLDMEGVAHQFGFDLDLLLGPIRKSLKEAARLGDDRSWTH